MWRQECSCGDAQILCDEWQTGIYSQTESQENYNVVLLVTEIIRHPNFDAKDKDPGAGSNIATSKVPDVCLKSISSTNRQTAAIGGIHSGWSKLIPLDFLDIFDEGYIPYYPDFFKQLQYRMDIQPRCKDPTKN